MRVRCARTSFRRRRTDRYDSRFTRVFEQASKKKKKRRSWCSEGKTDCADSRARRREGTVRRGGEVGRGRNPWKTGQRPDIGCRNENGTWMHRRERADEKKRNANRSEQTYRRYVKLGTRMISAADDEISAVCSLSDYARRTFFTRRNRTGQRNRRRSARRCEERSRSRLIRSEIVREGSRTGPSSPSRTRRFLAVSSTLSRPESGYPFRADRLSIEFYIPLESNFPTKRIVFASRPRRDETKLRLASALISELVRPNTFLFYIPFLL